MLSEILGKEVSVRSEEKTIKGEVIEVGLAGNLEVKGKDGTIKKVFFNDAV